MPYYELPTENKNNSPGHFQTRYRPQSDRNAVILLFAILILITLIGAIT